MADRRSRKSLPGAETQRIEAVAEHDPRTKEGTDLADVRDESADDIRIVLNRAPHVRPDELMGTWFASRPETRFFAST